MADIGTATIRILADSKGFERALNNIARGADRAGRNIGERLGESASRWLKRGLVVGAAGVAAAVGGVLIKGFKRFTTIEDATASLTLQLDSAKDAATLLGKVLKVVEGTPFALDQFVDAARNLVAASIPLEKIPGILAAVGDAAAAAGGTAEDVDQVVAAIGRLATGAELTLGPIRDLEQLGVPALRILANKAGKSTQDMAADISDATVDSQKAIDDLVDGIINGTEGINDATVAFGGAAKNVGNTVSGAFANMQIAVSRAGAKIIGVFSKAGKEGDAIVLILNRMREVIDILGVAAEASAKRIVGSDGFGRVLLFFDTLPLRVQRAIDQLGKKGGFSRALLAFFNASDFTQLTTGVLTAIESALDAVPSEQLGEVISLVIIKGVEAVSRFIPVIVASLVQILPDIARGIGEGLIQAARENPLDVAIFIAALGIPGVGAAIAGFFGALPFGFIVAPLITGISKAITAGFGALGLGQAFSILGGKLALGIVALAGPISAALLATLTVLAGIALGILLHNVVETFFPEVNRALEDAGGAIYDFFVGLPDKIVGALGDLGGRLYDIGRNAIDSLKRGAESVLVDSGWGQFWQNVGATAYDIVTGELQVRSPSKRFMFIGRQLVEGLKLGVEQGLPSLDATLSKLVPTDPLAFSVAGSGSAALSGSPIVHNWTINEATPQTTAEQVIARLATA